MLLKAITFNTSKRLQRSLISNIRFYFEKEHVRILSKSIFIQLVIINFNFLINQDLSCLSFHTFVVRYPQKDKHVARTFMVYTCSYCMCLYLTFSRLQIFSPDRYSVFRTYLGKSGVPWLCFSVTIYKSLTGKKLVWDLNRHSANLFIPPLSNTSL